MIPNKAQWQRWSLPSKLTAVGAYVGLISLAITVIVLLVENTRLKSESLHLSVGDYADETPIDIREGYGNHFPPQLTLTFPVTLINNGLRPVTIVHYELIPWNCDYDYTFRGQDGDQGFFSHSLDEKTMVLPFAIAPAEGKTVFLKTAVVVSFETTNIASDMEARSTIRDLIIETMYGNADSEDEYRSRDFFDNAVDYGVGVRGVLDYEPVYPVNQPIYKLVIHSASGKRYESLFAPYPIKHTHPYSTDCNPEPFSKKATLQVPEDWSSKRKSRKERVQEPE